MTSQDQTFLDACRDGKIGIAQSCIDKGETNLNGGLSSSCFFGNLDIAELCINSGATSFKLFLENGCFKGNEEIASWCVSHNCHPDSKINLSTGFACKNGCCNVNGL
jgi:hypothetical protein